MPYCSTPIPPLRTWLSECSKGAFWGLKVSNSAWLHFTRPLAQPSFSLLTLVGPKKSHDIQGDDGVAGLAALLLCLFGLSPALGPSLGNQPLSSAIPARDH